VKQEDQEEHLELLRRKIENVMKPVLDCHNAEDQRKEEIRIDADRRRRIPVKWIPVMEDASRIGGCRQNWSLII